LFGLQYTDDVGANSNDAEVERAADEIPNLIRGAFSLVLGKKPDGI